MRQLPCADPEARESPAPSPVRRRETRRRRGLASPGNRARCGAPLHRESPQASSCPSRDARAPRGSDRASRGPTSGWLLAVRASSRNASRPPSVPSRRRGQGPGLHLRPSRGRPRSAARRSRAPRRPYRGLADPSPPRIARRRLQGHRPASTLRESRCEGGTRGACRARDASNLPREALIPPTPFSREAREKGEICVLVQRQTPLLPRFAGEGDGG
jgi:hypothetical protein